MQALHPPARCALGLGEHKIDARTVKLAQLGGVGVLQTITPSARLWHRKVLLDGSRGDKIVYDTFGNDLIGDCTHATYGGGDWTVSAQLGSPTVVTRAMCETGYEATSPEGWVRTRPTENDHGGSMLDAARWWVKNGPFEAFVSVDVTNRRHVELAVNLSLGCVPVAVNLPLIAQVQPIWQMVPKSERDSRWEYGSWGGHSMSIVGYDAFGVYLFTWGRVKRASWEWLATYNRGECYAAFHKKVLTLDGSLTPAGYLASETRVMLLALHD